METANHLVVFTLDEQRYALHLAAVERIVRAAEVTYLPQAPGIVLGVVNIQGRVVPAMNMRKRLGLPERDLELDDRFIIARTKQQPVIVVADTVVGVAAYVEQDVLHAEVICSNMGHIEGVVKLTNGLVFIHDLDTFLSSVEERALNVALASL